MYSCNSDILPSKINSNRRLKYQGHLILRSCPYIISICIHKSPRGKFATSDNKSETVCYVYSCNSDILPSKINSNRRLKYQGHLILRSCPYIISICIHKSPRGKFATSDNKSETVCYVSETHLQPLWVFSNYPGMLLHLLVPNSE